MNLVGFYRGFGFRIVLVKYIQGQCFQVTRFRLGIFWDFFVLVLVRVFGGVVGVVDFGLRVSKRNIIELGVAICNSGVFLGLKSRLSYMRVEQVLGFFFGIYYEFFEKGDFLMMGEVRGQIFFYFLDRIGGQRDGCWFSLI